jgi:HEAT repeat protein
MATSEQVEDTVRQTRRIAMWPVLRKALQDENRDVRVLALDTLVAFKDPAAIPDLIRALADPDRHVRRRAAMGLGELQARAGVSALVRALQKDPDMGVRVRAIQALAILKDPTTVAPLLAVLESSSAQIQRLQQELEASGLAVTPAESPGQKETTGPSPSSTRAVEELKKELDNQTALQESAILALSRIDNEQARAKLAELDRQEFAAAEKAIEEMKAKRKKRL